MIRNRDAAPGSQSSAHPTQFAAVKKGQPTGALRQPFGVAVRRAGGRYRSFVREHDPGRFIDRNTGQTFERPTDWLRTYADEKHAKDPANHERLLLLSDWVDKHVTRPGEDMLFIPALGQYAVNLGFLLDNIADGRLHIEGFEDAVA